MNEAESVRAAIRDLCDVLNRILNEDTSVLDELRAETAALAAALG